ncbi:unnamed protein product [Brassicogethes aeneus]|uniref:Uncharacterized protein n=1 Tax=Brassicogethes aeneus TaxID=1431903 RepID=A0A9P0B1Z6_BRAAE|nr:unnamed protein product [Brassicogethes aeneus]
MTREMFYSFNTFNDLCPFLKCTCGLHSTGRPSFSLESTLKQSNKTPMPIKFEKWKSLLECIPSIYHGFYKNMIHQKSKEKKAEKDTTATTKREPGPSNTKGANNVESDDAEDFDDHDLDSDYE